MSEQATATKPRLKDSPVPMQTLDLGKPVIQRTDNLIFNGSTSAQFNDQLNAWSVSGDMIIDLQTSEKVSVLWRMNVCAGMTGNKIDCPITITINGTHNVLARSYDDKNASFHDVDWIIPDHMLQQGNNNVKISLDNKINTAFFIKSVTVYQSIETQKIDLSVVQPAATKDLSLSKDNKDGVYDGRFDSWCINAVNGYLRFNLNLPNPFNLWMWLSMRTVPVEAIVNCPVVVTVNGKALDNPNPIDLTEDFKMYPVRLSEHLLKGGLNTIQVTLGNHARAQVLINTVGITGC